MRQSARGSTVRRGLVAPRNMGPGAHPRTDGTLTLLLPAVANAKPKPQQPAKPVQGKKSSRSYMTPQPQPTFERVPDPTAYKWTAMNTDYQMRTMMALSGDLVDKGDRGALLLSTTKESATCLTINEYPSPHLQP